MKGIQFVLICLVLGVVLSGMIILGATFLNQVNGAKAVAMVNPNGVSPSTDLTYSQVNLNNSQANKNNAEGGLYDSQSAQNYGGVVYGGIIVFVVLGGFVFVAGKIGNG